MSMNHPASLVEQSPLPSHTSSKRPRSIARRLERLTPYVIGVWGVGLFLLGSSLMISHWFTLPRPPTDDPALRAHIATHRLPEERGGLFAVHLLYSECKCSQRILDHLAARGTLSGAHESVVLVGAHPEFEAAARQAGFRVDVVSPPELAARFGVQSAPLLVVADADDDIRYVGGYTERKQGMAIRDTAIMRGIQRGAAEAELPLFGCAVSQSLQDLIDPFRVKYTRTRE